MCACECVRAASCTAVPARNQTHPTIRSPVGDKRAGNQLIRSPADRSVRLCWPSVSARFWSHCQVLGYEKCRSVIIISKPAVLIHHASNFASHTPVIAASCQTWRDGNICINIRLEFSFTSAGKLKEKLIQRRSLSQSATLFTFPQPNPAQTQLVNSTQTTRVRLQTGNLKSPKSCCFLANNGLISHQAHQIEVVSECRTCKTGEVAFVALNELMKV